MSKHTPGGMWRLDRQQGTSKLAEIWCDTGSITINCGTDTPEIARLIAAAPEMWDLIQKTGDAIANMFEQMLRGKWRDDNGHDVQMNAQMLELAMAIKAAVRLRAKVDPSLSKSEGRE